MIQRAVLQILSGPGPLCWLIMIFKVKCDQFFHWGGLRWPPGCKQLWLCRLALTHPNLYLKGVFSPCCVSICKSVCFCCLLSEPSCLSTSSPLGHSNLYNYVLKVCRHIGMLVKTILCGAVCCLLPQLLIPALGSVAELKLSNMKCKF